MNWKRSFVIDLWPGGLVNMGKDPAQRCQRSIVLDGRRYLCQRARHESGIHDAFERHTDSGYVRW